MTNRLTQTLVANKETIARSWAERIKRSSTGYERVPQEEIEATCLRFIDALVHAVGAANYDSVKQIMSDVARLRASQGFDLPDVQRAFLMGCDALFAVVEEGCEGDARQLVWSVTQIDRAMHRSLDLLSQAFERVRSSELANARREARSQRDAAERRLQCMLAALSYGAIVVDAGLIVIWADELARSARCGAVSPGETHVCHPSQVDSSCLLQDARDTGQVQRREPAGQCVVWLAVPVVSEDGQVTEIIGLMGG